MSYSTNSIHVRDGAVDDLPSIRNLIFDSFMAMTEIYGPAFAADCESRAKSTIDESLSEEAFKKVFWSSYGCHFWVAESIEEGNKKNVVGCIGLVRLNHEEAELVRMAVDKNIRSHGIGSKLVAALEAFCLQTNVCRVVLTTANTRSARFYEKHGMVVTRVQHLPLENVGKIEVRTMCKYLGEKLVRSVCIVGGTHGNERVGVELVSQWSRESSQLQRGTLHEIKPYLANPEAVIRNVRFVEEDLNRQFTGTMEPGLEVDDVVPSKEKYLAKRINELLGPKSSHVSGSSCPAFDFCIDLHSTCSDVGMMAMISGADHDARAVRLARHLQTLHPELKITSSPGNKAASYSLDSVTPSGIAFEVGPLVHGSLSFEMLECTRRLVLETLDFFDARNQELLLEAQQSARAIGLAGFDEFNSKIVSAALAPNSVVPKSFPVIEYYSPYAAVPFPKAGVDEIGGAHQEDASMQIDKPDQLYEKALAARQGYTLHPSLCSKENGGNWRELEDGLPIFISTYGKEKVITFERKSFQIKESDTFPLYCVFVNEVAYLNRGNALMLYKKQTKCVI